MKTKTSLTRNSVNLSSGHCGTVWAVLLTLMLVCVALSPPARAVCQEGCDLSNGNTFLGDDALTSNTTGVNNSAIGSVALFSNTTGFDNTAVGDQALTGNTTGYLNTATGSYALQNNTTGVQNTAIAGLSSNTTGSYNTASGNGALAYNTTGNFNTASGFNALLYNTTGGNNIALGAAAGSNLTTGSHNIDIGNHGVRGEANTIRIGNQGTQTATFIAGISGASVPAGVAVIVDSSGHLGTTTSSERFKDEIKPMDRASEAILALQPMTFRYKPELDPDRIQQFGLVAEQVEKVNPDLVARGADGKPYTVRYDAVNAMLLNEFLKEHRKVEKLEATVAKLESVAGQRKDLATAVARQQEQIERLTSALKDQANDIQKVSDQIQLQNAAAQSISSER